MAIKTTTFQRNRTELKTLSSGTLSGLETAFATYESDKCDDDSTKTWSVRTVTAFYDGTNYVAIVEAYYPEINEDPLSQLPEPLT